MNSQPTPTKDLTRIPAQSLVQFAYVPKTETYQFAAEDSIPTMKLEGFPEDTDYSRFAMLHDGENYRVYFFRQNSNDTIYQGAFDPETETYQFGYDSIPELKITDAPKGTDFSSFAMLFDGEAYRLYFLPTGNVDKLIQFEYDEETQSYEPFVDLPILNTPADADWSGWGMLHDGTDYRLYTWKGDSNRTQIYQAVFDENEYDFDLSTIPVLNIAGTPPASYRPGFSMLFDSEFYRFYLQTV